jgi:transcriptional regulator with XRE-family HTH domain
MAEMALSDLVSERVRRELAARKLAAADLAPVLGVDKQTAQRRVSGRNSFAINDLPKLASFFGVPVSTFTSEPVAA